MILNARRRVFLSLFSLFFVFSCGSSGTGRVSGGGGEIRQQLSDGLVEEIRGLTETGVLSSMLQALELIRSRNLAAVEFGRMMSGINTLLIKFVYSDFRASLPSLNLPQTLGYTRIIREAERGNYVRPSDDSTDFFEYILPFAALGGQIGAEIQANVLRDLAKAAEIRPNSVLPHYFRGLLYERARRFPESEAAYRQANGISAECYPALTGIARVRRLSGNPGEAATLFSGLMVRYPDSIDIKYQLAVTYFELRDFPGALSVVDQVLRAEPGNGEFLLMKASILIEQRQFSSANTVLDAYSAINSNNRSYLFMRARVQAEGNQNRDSALNYLRSILRSSPNDAEVLVYASGLLMESTNAADLNEGRGLLERLRRVSGSSLDVLGLSLRDALQRENWQEAQGFLNRILAVRRNVQDLIDGYNIERGLGNNSRALSYAREVYDRDTSNPDYAFIYISALIDNNRKDEASRLLESRFNSSGGGAVKSRYYFLRSRLQTNQEAALGDLRSSLFEDPRNLDAIIASFEIYHNRREERRAVYYLRQALAIAPDLPRLRRYEREYASLLGRN